MPQALLWRPVASSRDICHTCIVKADQVVESWVVYCRMEEASKEAEQRLDRAESRAAHLQRDLSQAEHRAQQVLPCPALSLPHPALPCRAVHVDVHASQAIQLSLACKQQQKCWKPAGAAAVV